MILLLALAAAIGFGWWFTHPPDAGHDVRAHFAPLASVDRVPAPELGARFERWTMRDTHGRVTTGLWRPAPPGPGPRWVVVLLGGIGTDDRAALLVPDALPVSVLAVSWPWTGPRRMDQLGLIVRTPGLRSAMRRTPACLATGVAAARRAEPGAKVALLGASLGVAPAVAAAQIERPDALALVDGAADLRRLLRSEIARAASPALAPAGSALGARLLSSLEPARHAPALAGLPVLLVDAEHEARYPPACVAALHAAFPHATVATHPGGHLRPEDSAQVLAIVEQVWGWLRPGPDGR